MFLHLKRYYIGHNADNRRFYASSFESKVPRFGNAGPVLESTDVIYDTDKTKTSGPSTVQASVEVTPIRYAIHRSKFKRFTNTQLSEGPDVVYGTLYRKLCVGISRSCCLAPK